MAQLPLLFSLIFFTAFAFYLFFGLYIIYINPKASQNRLFLLVCISLCFWSFGFSIANSAPNIETCLLWRRISAVGWGSIYSLLLHFLLLLSENKLIKNRLFMTLLHIPALISVYVFAISGNITANQYNFIKMHYGWVNVAIQNSWTFFFYIYYIGYLLASLWVVWHWRVKASDYDARKQASMIFYSILSALMLGSFTDVILSSFFSSPLPQMAPVVTLIPVGALYFSLKLNNLLQGIIENKDEYILSQETLSQIYFYLGIAYMAGGILGFLSKFLPHLISGEANLKNTLYSGIILFLLGCAILLFRLIKKETLKNPLIMIAALLSIPIITLRFIEFSSITIWVFPILLIIVSLTFNTRKPLVLVTIISILTQIIVWYFAPSGPINMDEFDFILRVGIFILAFWLGSLVNRIYVKKIEENIQQIEFQKLVSDISFDFININQKNISEKSDKMIEKTGRHFNADRAYIVLLDKPNNIFDYAHEWCNDNIEPRKEIVKDIPINAFPWTMDQLKKNKIAVIDDISMLPIEADIEKNHFSKQDIKSLLLIAIEENDELLGYIGLDSMVFIYTWTNYHIKLLKILANLYADGLLKIKAEKEIEYLAYYDHLTGLPNRNLFSDRLNQAIELARRTGSLVSVILLDLDSFKMINEIMGHSVGDTVIKEVGQYLAENLRKTDTVARFGGDEFLVMLNNIFDIKDITTVADNIMKLFGKPFILNGQEFFITCSAGIAIYSIDGEDTESLIQNADIAMHRAKSRGKNQYVLCTEGMKEEVKKNMKISNCLYRVLERNELSVFYQPQIKVETGEIIGLEALLRWNHPEMGMIPPNVFIPLAEKNGLINSIGEWVLKTASRQNKKWQDMGFPHMRMAVNLSIVQFNNPRIVDVVNNALKESGLNPKYLELEITESIAIGETKDTVGILNNLKNLGISISIDDFGTAYSSLNRLKMLPVDRIKIDMQFIQAIENSEKDQAITKVIINLAKTLGLGVLAEGVETISQLEFLRSKLCDEVQGFYFYKPISSEEIEKILKKIFAKKAGLSLPL